ncbi:GPI-anchored protein LLG1-like [Phoenix dactylifera]|uniref:GPI-anchored protein LLG1-like n=1 Tax=Phoenix dactylifera TaxID=42345 RepID=A0A8B7CT74_PHODC|nr:GPI-anchored protein LLG1-like [Phoenix dactylifera]
MSVIGINLRSVVRSGRLEEANRRLFRPDSVAPVGVRALLSSALSSAPSSSPLLLTLPPHFFRGFQRSEEAGNPRKISFLGLEMDLSRSVSLRAALFMCFVGLAAASTFISDDVFQCHGPTGRSLLQTKKSCPVNFEFLNYTIITSKCKGPQYSAKLCCGAFKEFACPYAEELNDSTNDCASTMFSYINLYGKYPPGLFASECREGKEGLACPSGSSKSQDENVANAGHVNRSLTFLIVLVSGMVLALVLS